VNSSRSCLAFFICSPSLAAQVADQYAQDPNSIASTREA
jgi:hypothetical protein